MQSSSNCSNPFEYLHHSTSYIDNCFKAEDKKLIFLTTKQLPSTKGSWLAIEKNCKVSFYNNNLQ
jgi:hypothetical protein